MKIRGLIEAMAQSFMHRKHNSGRKHTNTRCFGNMCAYISLFYVKFPLINFFQIQSRTGNGILNM